MGKNLATKEWRPSVTQEGIVELLLVDGETVIDACKKIGINRQAYYRWFTDKKFVAWYDEQRAVYLKSNVTKVDRACLEVASIADSKNVQDRKLLYERLGEIGKQNDNKAIVVVFTDEWNKIKDPVNENQIVVDAEIVKGIE